MQNKLGFILKKEGKSLGQDRKTDCIAGAKQSVFYFA